jgi:hypothetical protein
MKKIMCLIAICSLFANCKKESADPAPPPTPTYTKVDVVSLTVTAFPGTDAAGNTWDNPLIDSPDPDTYFSINDAAGNPLIISSTQWNLTVLQVPLKWNFTPKWPVPNFNATYMVNLWDDDSNINNPDDLMGTVIALSPSNLVSQGYPTTSDLVSTNNKFKATLTLNWHN